jgi:hypothetical protein
VSTAINSTITAEPMPKYLRMRPRRLVKRDKEAPASMSIRAVFATIGGQDGTTRVSHSISHHQPYKTVAPIADTA